MKAKFFLSMAAMAAFAALPAIAQHGHGGGGAGGSLSSSMHGSDHDHSSSTHGKSDDHDMDHDGSGHGRRSISQKLASNTKLASKLQSLLPPGTNLQSAAEGFKNLGQFVAAVHVSHNLGIPFDQLKSKMLGPPSMSLGKAIQALQPTANAKAATKQAESEAKADMKSSS